ncbi:hypothetical protein AAHC03_019164 [Spirometra sp. Aus1]
MVRRGEVILIDVRTPEEAVSTIPHLRFAVEKFRDALDLTDDSFCKKYAFDRRRLITTPPVFICKAGIRSMKALIISKEFGIEKFV